MCIYFLYFNIYFHDVSSSKYISKVIGSNQIISIVNLRINGISFLDSPVFKKKKNDSGKAGEEPALGLGALKLFLLRYIGHDN